MAEGSITAGARRMHLSLPSASARVRALEHHAGVALLIRERRGCVPPRRARRWPATHGTFSPRRHAWRAPWRATPGPRPPR
ncbi:LysR family transcriptional regulator [Streptomyces malaysiensis subsp. malaysiensis]